MKNTGIDISNFKWNKNINKFNILFNNNCSEHDLHAFIKSNDKKILNYICTPLLINYIQFSPSKDFTVFLDDDKKIDIKILDNHYKQHKIYYNLHHNFIKSKLEENNKSVILEEDIINGLNRLYLNIKFTDLAKRSEINNAVI